MRGGLNKSWMIAVEADSQGSTYGGLNFTAVNTELFPKLGELIELG